MSPQAAANKSWQYKTKYVLSIAITTGDKVPGAAIGKEKKQNVLP